MVIPRVSFLEVQTLVQQEVAQRPPQVDEVIRAMVKEVLSQLSGFYPIFQAIGWAVVAYFFILIIFALARFMRARKQMKILEDISSTLHEIKDKLPGNHTGKEKSERKEEEKKEKKERKK